MATGNDKIIIQEKPDWVSWDDIEKCLYEAHSYNRNNGIKMGHQNMTGNEIKDLLGENSHMLVAVDNGCLVGCAAMKVLEKRFWYGKGIYAYCCFASVLPQYAGQGIYHRFVEKRETIARQLGINMMFFNTSPDNKRVIKIAEGAGYKKVSYSISNGFPYVFLVKWLNGCPFSVAKCKYEYLKRKFLVKTMHTVKSLVGE